MTGTTAGVYDLVRDAIQTVPTPYTEDVIEDVCVAIEGDPQFMKRYNALVASLGKMVTNNAIGTHAKALSGMQTVKQVPATRAKIIGSYTKLKP
jgi:hypothetical protein